MNNLPQIVVSTYDLDRLEAVLQAMPAARRNAYDGLQRELERALIVVPADVPANVVSMNSIVRFTLSGSNMVREVRLCFPRDMDGSPERLSVLSPVGTALLGLAEGETITWAGPSGSQIELKVETVVFQPERGLTQAV